MNNEMLRVDVSVSFEDISDAMSRLPNEELVALFLKIDLQMAEVGFTEELIRGLTKSLKADKDDVDLPFIDWSKV